MEEVPLFSQPSKLSKISSFCLANNLVNCMGSYIADVLCDCNKDGSASDQSVPRLSKWLQVVKEWWESEAILDPTSPMHKIMKDAVVEVAENKWKNKETAWAALLISFLFDSLTIDCICGSTGESADEVNEKVYLDILTLISPLALNEIKLVSNKLCAWQTRLVRDLLYHSPHVTSIQVPVLSHNLLDGIARTPNLEELEVMANMNYSQCDILERAAQIFFGAEDYFSLMVEAERGKGMQLPFPRLKKFFIQVDECTSEFCHAMLMFYPDVKFGHFYLPEIEYLNCLLSHAMDDDNFFGIGSIFIDDDGSRFGPNILKVDHLIIESSFFSILEEEFDTDMLSGITKLDIFDRIYHNFELIGRLLNDWNCLTKLGIRNIEFLEIVKNTCASQLISLELSAEACVLEAYDYFVHFPNLKHLMFSYSGENKVLQVKEQKCCQIEELTIKFLPLVDNASTELLRLVMASLPCLKTLHLIEVTCAMWTNGYLKNCGNASIKYITVTTREQLDSSYSWLEPFPSLEKLTVKSTIHQNCHLVTTSQLNIKYVGVLIPHLNWLGNYRKNDYLYPDDE